MTLVSIYGMTRILYSVSKDGLIGSIFSKVYAVSNSPNANVKIVGFFVAIIAAFIPSGILWNMVSIGTLVAFIVVSTGVMIMRIKHPEMPRGFKVPFGKIFPLVSIASCLYLITSLGPVTYITFAVWMVFSIVLYAVYSAQHSRLEKHKPAELKR